MSLRRYTPMRQSIGTVIPLAVRNAVKSRDQGCAGPAVGMALPCQGGIELDHIAGSGALGKKSPSVETNLISLCGRHHLVKTEYGRLWRPKLLAWVAAHQ